MIIMLTCSYNLVHIVIKVKGQLISKANSKLFIGTKKTNENIFCISALASKIKVVES